MRKYVVAVAGLCIALAFTGCKSSESAYKKAYEKAKAQEENRATDQNQGNEEIAVVAPVVEKPATETVVVDTCHGHLFYLSGQNDGTSVFLLRSVRTEGVIVA